MDNKYSEYCMNFTNDELKDYLISSVKKRMTTEIKLLSEDGTDVDISSNEKIETIIFDGEEENLFINFYGVHTSIFAFDKEIMFIDENSKGIYTTSDVFNNVVYEGKLRELNHKEILQMFSDFIVCFSEAKAISLSILNDEQKKYKDYNYYTPHIFIINVDNGQSIRQEKVFKNITVKF